MSVLIAVAVLSALFFAVALLRKKSIDIKRNWALQQLPSRTQLCWTRDSVPISRPIALPSDFESLHAIDLSTYPRGIEAEHGSRTFNTTWSFNLEAAAADGVLSALPVLEAVRQIDPEVLAAIKESTTAHIQGLPSVHDYVTHHFFDAPTQTADGWFERLTGYVTEQKAASALEAAGHHVTFAATSNQPVWDLLVDGSPVQVKEGITGVKAFLLEHHGIPIYTGEQVASSVKDPLVHGLKGLSSSQIHELTHHSVDGISDVYHAGFHFPVVTLAFSSYREIKLLIADKTTFERAAAHVGMDVVGVGAGTLAGVKAGAVIGAFFTPAGAAAGALVGGVIGGISGKLASTSMRHVPFRSAVADFEDCSVHAENAVDAAVVQTQGDIRTLDGSFQRQYILERDTVIQESVAKIASTQSALETAFLNFADDFVAFLYEIGTKLETEQAGVVGALPALSWRARFWPSEQDVLRNEMLIWFNHVRSVIATERESIMQAPRTLRAKKAEIVRFAQAYSFDISALSDCMAVLHQEYLHVQDEIGNIRHAADLKLASQRGHPDTAFRSRSCLHSREAFADNSRVERTHAREKDVFAARGFSDWGRAIGTN